MEFYKIIENHENYEISNFGNVRNTKTGRILKPSLNTKGYKMIKLHRDGISTSADIHRLVGIAFIENPNGKMCIDHIDNNKTNNSLENLRWVSYSENNRNISKQKNASSKYLGVSKKRKKFQARISIDGKQVNIGLFKDEIEAVKAYNNKVLEINDKYRKLNLLI